MDFDRELAESDEKFFKVYQRWRNEEVSKHGAVDLARYCHPSVGAGRVAANNKIVSCKHTWLSSFLALAWLWFSRHPWYTPKSWCDNFKLCRPRVKGRLPLSLGGRARARARVQRKKEIESNFKQFVGKNFRGVGLADVSFALAAGLSDHHSAGRPSKGVNDAVCDRCRDSRASPGVGELAFWYQ